MNYMDIIKKMKKKEFENLYLFYGRENYLLDNVIKVAKNTLNQGLVDLNFSYVINSGIFFDELKSNINTLPFMEDNRIVLIKDFEMITGKKKCFSQSDEDKFLNLLEDIPSSTIIIFVVYLDNIDLRKKIVKLIKNNGIVVNCDKLKGVDLLKWTKNKFKKANVNIRENNIIHFLNLQGYENKNSENTLLDIENEILKIASFSKEYEVSKDMIDNVCVKEIEKDIFKLMDAIGNKNTSLALNIFNDMLLEGESSFMVLSMIARYFKTMIQCKKLQNIGYSAKIISDKIGVHTFVANKAIKQGSNIDTKIMIENLNECLELDYKIKQGLIKSDLGMEMLISKICININ